MRLRTLGLATVLGMVAALTLTVPASAHDGDHHGGHHHGGRPLSATLRGANETPFVGDPDGSGTAYLRLNPGHGRICFRIQVTGVTLPATAANVYQGAAGVSGTFVAALLAPTTTGNSEGCVSASRDTLIAIMGNPSAYYVNVFTADFPNGAVRGQLGGGSGATSTGDRTFSVSLRGANESPLPGDPDGWGSASISVQSSQNQICYSIRASAIWLPATATYIQQGPPGTVGAVVVTLVPPNVSGVSSGCVAGLAPSLVSSILSNPSGYYLNVATFDFPGGALRGQLGCGDDDDDHVSTSWDDHPGGGGGCGEDD